MTDNKNGEASPEDILDQVNAKLGVADEGETLAAAEESAAPTASAVAETSTPVAGSSLVHPHDAEQPMTNEEAIGYVFSGDGSERPVGDPTTSAAYDADLPEERSMAASSVKTLVLTVVAMAVVVGIGFAVLPGELKGDAVKLLQGQDIIELR